MPSFLLYIKLEVRVGFEPTVLRLCRPLHWTTLPPYYGVLYGIRTHTTRSTISGANRYTNGTITLVENLGIEPSMPEATDLQSAEVTNASHSPKLAVCMGLEPMVSSVTGRRFNQLI